MQFPASTHATHLAVILRQCIHACLSLGFERKQHNDATGCTATSACVHCEWLYRWACLHEQVCVCVYVCVHMCTRVYECKHVSECRRSKWTANSIYSIFNGGYM